MITSQVEAIPATRPYHVNFFQCKCFNPSNVRPVICNVTTISDAMFVCVSLCAYRPHHTIYVCDECIDPSNG